MGFNTLFWGPSGWQLFHLIAFFSANPQQVLLEMKEILPCKFCRASTKDFVREHPLKGDPGKWLYDIHTMVNNKLRTQCADNPDVPNPGPDPSFEDVKRHYESLRPNAVPGRDFLFTIAANYPDDPAPEDMARQREFMENLADVYPFPSLRRTFKSYLVSHRPVGLDNKKQYQHWMFGLLSALSRTAKSSMPTYRGYVARVMFHASGCDKATYRGVTCRRTKQGFRTKTRDNARTRKVVHQSLLL